MDKLVHGVRRFQAEVFPGQARLFERLGKGQQPSALFVACVDSRIVPHLLLQAEPGDVLVFRNPGNLIPPIGQGGQDVAATLEFALEGLHVRHIVVCGHSHCGAMRALLAPAPPPNMPALATWLDHGAPNRRAAMERYENLDDEARLEAVIRDNAQLQLDSLRTYPAVLRALEAGQLNLHAWVYAFQTGAVQAFHSARQAFVPLDPADYAPAV